MTRWSVIDCIKVFNLSEASFIQVGDNMSFNSASKVITVQRQVPTFYANEGNFNKYPIFSRALPLPETQETISMNIINECDVIKVGSITIIGVAGSSVFQVGKNTMIESEARVKEFKQLITAPPPKAKEETDSQEDEDI